MENLNPEVKDATVEIICLWRDWSLRLDFTRVSVLCAEILHVYLTWQH